jgi:cytoskeletal protein CcmA (bactofilin family)
MTKDREFTRAPRTATRLGPNTRLKGILRFKESVTISGKFEGQIDSDGYLYIEDGAVVEADVKAQSIIVAGVVRGNIIASEQLEMLPSGKIYGNVKTAKLRIADGVVFEGKCEMIRKAENVDIFGLSVDELKESVQRV